MKKKFLKEAILFDTLNALSTYLEKNNEDLLKEISNIENHTFSLILNKGENDYKLRLEDSVKLRNNARQLILAASHSVLSPQILHPAFSKKDAKDFLQEC